MPCTCIRQLKGAGRGTLTGSPPTGISNKKFEQNWTLDALGNWTEFDQDDDGNGWDLEQEREHNNVNEITSISGGSWVVPDYDAAGNMIEGPKPGSPTTKHKHVYDAWNRLVKVTDASDNTIEEYQYDGLGRRIVKKTAYSGGSPQDTYDYYYDGSQVVEEHLDGDEEYPLAQYVWHPYYIDALAVRYYDSGTDGSPDAHYYTHDANFNVTALLDDGGAPLERYHYDPHGETTLLAPNWGEHTTDYHNPYRYTGRRFDEETGLYYYRARYYHPTLGRFNRRDRILYQGGDMNLYVYVGNSPTNHRDPTGLYCPDCAPGSVNKANVQVVAVETTTVGRSPYDFLAYSKLLADLNTLHKIAAVKEAATGAVSGLAGGSLAKALKGGVKGVAEYKGTVQQEADEVLENFRDSLKLSYGYHVWVKVEFQKCVPCSCTLDPTSWFKTKYYEWRTRHGYVKCTEGSAAVDKGVYGGVLHKHATDVDISKCAKRAVREKTEILEE